MLTGIKENAKFQKKKNGQNNEQSEQTSGLKHLVDGVKQHHNVKYGPSSLKFVNNIVTQCILFSIFKKHRLISSSIN
jgi:hypothetical protein